ncbi:MULTISPECIES: TasA family protein [Bacillaceae]|nr:MULTISPECIES: TasA family protein [Bacillaceae]
MFWEGRKISIKRKLVMGIAGMIVGLSLIVEGSYAYFTDTHATDSFITNGTLNLEVDKETLMQIENMVPGDTVEGRIELSNNGSIDMEKVLLHSTYEVVDKGEPNQEDDLGEHIRVKLIHHDKEGEKVLFQQRLSQLTNNPEQMINAFPSGSGKESFTVQFTFVDNGGNQNHFQADKLKVKWNFEAVQRDGKTSSASSTHASFHDKTSIDGNLAIGTWNQEKSIKTDEQSNQQVEKDGQDTLESSEKANVEDKEQEATNAESKQNSEENSSGEAGEN